MFQDCSSSGASGLSDGKHVVTMHATLPGTTVVAVSSPVEVSLQCDNGVFGCSATGSGAAPWLGLALLAVIRRARRRTA